MADSAQSGAASAALIATVGSLLEPLEAALRPLGPVCVAFSGGVDSSVVLAVATRVLGASRVVAFTAVSETYRDDELAAARALTSALGVRHLTWQTRELDDQRFVANTRDRCYFCKATMLEAMQRAAAATGETTLIDGANRDDLGDERPGMRAAAEHGVRHPLVEAGLGKPAVRALARALDLPSWSKPAEACLASRIAYDQPITADKLRQVAAAEDVLRELGLGPELRVRHHGDVARIELPADGLERAAAPALRETVVRRLHALGFTYVALDLLGFRSGSMNEAPRTERSTRS
jgi:pyridinium-3,5-biscarboxylic acid mononucleotide sulfurtransferase